MRFMTAMLLLAVAQLATPTLASETTNAAPASKSVLHDNAALQYWQAFAAMPTLSKDQEKLLAEWRTASLEDPAVKELVERSRTSLRFFRRASQLKDCDWGLDYREGLSLMMPQLVRARELSRLAALSARYEFEHGNQQSLEENARSIMVLARHIGHDPFLICLAVQYGLEDMAIDLVAPYVPEIKISHAEVVAAFEALPPAATLHESIVAEKEYMATSILKELREAEKQRPGGWRELWAKFLEGSEVPPELRDVKSLDELNKMVTDFFATYDEFAAMAELPKPEFDVKYSELEKRLKATSPMSAVMLPTLDKLADKRFASEARMSMLLAAVAMNDGGREKLNEIRDPFGDGPFAYREVPGGFELQSKLVVEGKPVTLTVGRAKK